MTDNKLGPRAMLAGTWEGDHGSDIAPGADLGVMQTAFRERMVFEPIGEVTNHQQSLCGLRYTTIVWPAGKDEPFHEEVGYWLWDAANRQVMRSFAVPRGYAVLAGGAANSGDSSFQVVADLGSATCGICSNRFLDEAFHTVRFQCNVTIHDADSFSYEEDTQIQIRGQADLFHHRDANRLVRTR